jgi:predicted transcriptional regulator
MKSASMPSLRVDPELRQAAEAVLREGESLSSFMEQSLRDQVTRRQLQREFMARALASRDEARQTGEYFDAEEVHAELRGMLTKASAGKAKR